MSEDERDAELISDEFRRRMLLMSKAEYRTPGSGLGGCADARDQLRDLREAVALDPRPDFYSREEDISAHERYTRWRHRSAVRGAYRAKIKRWMERYGC